MDAQRWKNASSALAATFIFYTWAAASVIYKFERSAFETE